MREARRPGLRERKLLDHNQPGEIELSGPSLMAGYFQNEDATRETMLPDGFIRTGDLGMTYPDSRFAFLTRLGDLLFVLARSANQSAGCGDVPWQNPHC